MLTFLKSVPMKAKKQIVSFRGINYSDAFRDGDLRESLNISTRRFPYLTTRRARQKVEEYSNVSAISVRGALVVVQGTDLLYDGQVVGTVTAGEKQFAVVNTKLVIWPDRVYLDLVDMKVKQMAVKVSGTGAKFTAEHGDITVPSTWPDLTTMFKVGDGVTITGSSKEKNNQTLKILSMTKNLLSFGPGVFEDSTEAGTVFLERKVPEMDFICEANNRLWGCSSKAQTIYCSVLGDPTNFNVISSTAEDSWAVAVGSDGDFTGCCRHGSSVLFWKEARLHKLLGTIPDEFSLYDYAIEGVQKGSHKSLQIINEILYYMGPHGVYAYSGNLPTRLSENFGEKYFTDGVAGNDGDNYYLSAWEGGQSHLLVYETKSGFWFREDATNAIDFARIGKDLYMLDDTGTVWIVDTHKEDPTVEWMAQFTPFHETAEGRKMFSKIILRVELPKGAWLKVDVRCDNGKWRTVGKVIGKDMDSIPIQLPINRCDAFDVKLSGYGPCTIKTMLLEYSMGSDV